MRCAADVSTRDLLVRRRRSGQKPHFVELALLATAFGQQQMPIMHRIERPAKQA